MLEYREELEKQTDMYKKFSVDAIDKGYGMWSYGGFDCVKHTGKFWIPVSPEGEPLPELARKGEKNARHVFHIIYPECYILQAVCPQPPVVCVDIFRVKWINRATETAYCAYLPLSEIPDQDYQKLQAALDTAREGCITVNNVDNHYFWRVK